MADFQLIASKIVIPVESFEKTDSDLFGLFYATNYATTKPPMGNSLPLDDPATEVCALCLLGFDRLSRSHIVPEFHFKRMKDENDQFFKSSSRGRLEKPIQTGLFERLLCGQCEARFNEGFENEVHQLFESGAFSPDGVGMREDFFVEADYRSFRLYMLSILWRASVASRPPFDDFALDPACEEFLRRCLLSLSPPPPLVLPFAVLTVEFDGGWTHEWVIMPQNGKAGDVHTAHFVVGGLLVCFFLSPTALDEEMNGLLMGIDGVQKLRRMHINHIEGLANAVVQM